MELIRSTSRGGFSVRSVITFVLAVITTVMLWAILAPTPTHAAPEATVNGDSILYDGHTYNKADPTTLSKSHGLPEGTLIYVYYSPNNVEASAKEAFFFYFAPGTDPPTATSAQYMAFDYNSSNNTFSNGRGNQTIALKAGGQEDTYSSCTVSGGLGWIICPVTVFLADSMDNLFNIIAGFLNVQPLMIEAGADNGLYTAWNVMRNIANVAFVIAFLIIIYSQLTNTGLSNYSLKKIIPRLVIAAVLVNVSFIISALAIDISNILGFSIQDILNTIRKDVFHISDETLGTGMNNGWSVVAAAVLGGGGAIAGTAYAVSSGAVYLLIPMLVLLALTVLIVLIVLAARQAIIIILVIIAPLAFVANLLPNTEKWFDKWRDLFMTMLIFFPAFSLVFGGSQLAGQIIIMNAGDNLIMVLFGMAVQVAPLVITPLLLKLSGSLLGRIAQIANNPSKGLLDRNKKWAGDRAELRRQKSVANGFGANPMRWGAGMVRGNEFRRRNLQGKLDTAKQRAENAYHGSDAYQAIHADNADAQLRKEAIDSSNKAHLLKEGAKFGTKLNVSTLEVENAKVSLENATAQTGQMTSAYRANRYDTTGHTRLTELQKAIGENVIETAAWKQGEQNNQYIQQRGISRAMSDASHRDNARLLDMAQGAGYGDPDALVVGRERAQANAVATLTKLNKDARENTITLMETEAVAAKKSVKAYALEDIYSKASSANPNERNQVTRARLEAALEIAAADGNVSTFDNARANEFVDQSIVDAVVARNTGTFKAKGGFHIQADPTLSLQRYIATFDSGNTQYGASLDEVRQTFFKDQALNRLTTLSNTTAENLGGMKYGAFTGLAADMLKPDDRTGKTLLDYIPHAADGSIIDEGQDKMMKQIFETLREGLNDPSTRATMTDRLTYARSMEEKLRDTFFKQADPLELSEPERIQSGTTMRPARMDENTLLTEEDLNVDPTAETPTDNSQD